MNLLRKSFYGLRYQGQANHSPHLVFVNKTLPERSHPHALRQCPRLQTAWPKGLKSVRSGSLSAGHCCHGNSHGAAARLECGSWNGVCRVIRANPCRVPFSLEAPAGGHGRMLCSWHTRDTACPCLRGSGPVAAALGLAARGLAAPGLVALGLPARCPGHLLVSSAFVTFLGAQATDESHDTAQ